MNFPHGRLDLLASLALVHPVLLVLDAGMRTGIESPRPASDPTIPRSPHGGRGWPAFVPLRGRRPRSPRPGEARPGSRSGHFLIGELSEVPRGHVSAPSPSSSCRRIWDSSWKPANSFTCSLWYNGAMRKLDLAWAAGFVDGEGCISLHTVKAKSGPCYVLRLAVANTNFVMLEHLQRIFNMGNLIQRPPINTRCKLTGHWQVCSKQA